MMKHQRETVKRLSYLIGHLNGVKKMVENNEYCIDVINQNLGVISALKKVNERLLRDHLDSCVTAALRGDNKAEREAKLKELQEILPKL